MRLAQKSQFGCQRERIEEFSKFKTKRDTQSFDFSIYSNHIMYSNHLLEFIGALPVKLVIHLKTLHMTTSLSELLLSSAHIQSSWMAPNSAKFVE